MQIFFGLGYLVIGFAQLFAIMDGLKYALNLNGFFAAVLALIVTYIPVLGSLLGIYGAVTVWHWSLLQAVALFFWYLFVLAAIYILGGASTLLGRR